MKPSNRTLRFAIGCVTLALLLIPAAMADTWDKKTDVTFGEAVEVPGGTVLAPGHYVLKLLNSPSDRHIVQVYNQNQNHLYATILAIPAKRSEPADKTIITFYETPQERPVLIHTWFYPGDTSGQEFSYPKNRLTYAATASSSNPPVLAEAAPDPAPLSGTRTRLAEPTDPGLVSDPPTEPPEAVSQAERSQVPAEESVLLAQATPQQGTPQTPRTGGAAGDTAPADQLPETASSTPLWAAGSLVLFAAAFSLRIARRRVRG